MAQTGSTYNLIADNDIIPWMDDNEIKYKWNGALTNLSNMDPKDYATTIFNIYGVVVTAVTGSTLVSNEVKLEVKEEDNVYVVEITTSQPILSEQTLDITVGGVQKRLVLSKGSTSGKVSTDIPTTESKPSISEAKITPGKDSTYTYDVEIPIVGEEFISYHGTVLEKDANSLSTADIAAMDMVVIDVTGQTLNFVIPARAVEDPTAEDLKNCTYCLIFCLPKQIYDEGKYKIVDSGVGQSSGFQKNPATFTINKTEFVLLCNYSEGNEFVGRYGKDISYNFKANYKSE